MSALSGPMMRPHIVIIANAHSEDGVTLYWQYGDQSVAFVMSDGNAREFAARLNAGADAALKGAEYRAKAYDDETQG
jgi:alkanesulfonate monooxygenase SsuD/methylene tetrahydromethanopterin reductase-like flavin-dependent oxidoreductase (luciferase family)